MRKRVTILGILLVFCLCGCSETTGAINKEKTKEVADQMTDFLLDNTAFPNPNSKEEIKSIINGATDVVIESADDTLNTTLSDDTINSLLKEAQIEKSELPENLEIVQIPEHLLSTVLTGLQTDNYIVDKKTDNLYVYYKDSNLIGIVVL